MVFSAELEDNLAAYLVLVELGRRYYGMTYVQALKFAYEYAMVLKGLQHGFDDEAKMAGVDWLKVF